MLHVWIVSTAVTDLTFIPSVKSTNSNRHISTTGKSAPLVKCYIDEMYNNLLSILCGKNLHSATMTICAICKTSCIHETHKRTLYIVYVGTTVMYYVTYHILMMHTLEFTHYLFSRYFNRLTTFDHRWGLPTMSNSYTTWCSLMHHRGHTATRCQNTHSPSCQHEHRKERRLYNCTI